jgi:hypothetical protein
MNIVFCFASYPASWCTNKLITIFKGGDPLLCGNYRGISIMESCAKVFDMLLNERLKRWARPAKEQAGAQEKRGCVEQIMALRLLVDYARYTRRKLFICYVDFSKAYDKVPRHKLIECLLHMGCGSRFLAAIIAMYKCTRNVLRTATLIANIGVRQGASTSCLLFTLYIDKLVTMIKTRIADDGFLGGIHCMLLMDDTVLLATSREMCVQKFDVLLKFCNEYGMELNLKKTKFMAINGSAADKEPIIHHEHRIEHCEKYVYLGGVFTSLGDMKSVLVEESLKCRTDVNKFAVFIAKNASMPYVLKKKVAEAAVLTSMMYSSESWLSKDLSRIESHYHALIKILLGVRPTTANLLCLIESGFHDLATLVHSRRAAFLNSKLSNPDHEEPFIQVYDLCRRRNTPGYRLCEFSRGYSATDTVATKCRKHASHKTKFSTYLEFNPQLCVNSMYEDISIPEHHRIAVTRFRLSSHNFLVEKLRWLRVPHDQRVCPCDGESIQDEYHVFNTCAKTQGLREQLGITILQQLRNIFGVGHDRTICTYVYNISKLF